MKKRYCSRHDIDCSECMEEYCPNILPDDGYGSSGWNCTDEDLLDGGYDENDFMEE